MISTIGYKQYVRVARTVCIISLSMRGAGFLALNVLFSYCKGQMLASAC